MTPETAGWAAKAEADFISAGREYRARRNPNFDAACFHAQQAAEKYLKAVLTEAGVDFPRVHSLTLLLHRILPLEPAWTVLKPEAAQLTAYAVEFRYPGKTADKLLARDAVKQAARIRECARRRLGLAAAQQRPKARRTHGKSQTRTRSRKKT